MARRQRKALSGQRLREAEAAAIDVLRLVRGLVLRDIDAGVLPLTPALRAELRTFDAEAQLALGDVSGLGPSEPAHFH